jgi:hypothetical protein
MKSKKTKTQKAPAVVLPEQKFAGRTTSMVPMKSLVRAVRAAHGDIWTAGDIGKCFSGLIAKSEPFFYWNDGWHKVPEDWHDALDHIDMNDLLKKAHVPALWAKQVLKLAKVGATSVYPGKPPRVEFNYGDEPDSKLDKVLKRFKLDKDWTK